MLSRVRDCKWCGQPFEYFFWRDNTCRNCKKIKHTVNNHRTRAKAFGLTEHFTFDEWVALCARHGNKCLKCGEYFDLLSPDHIIPLSAGGTNTIDNIQCLCWRCNIGKGVNVIDYR
jgi:5-methylcytosine-specific restriction endonuclease McrA